jgi:hypothetical protein
MVRRALADHALARPGIELDGAYRDVRMKSSVRVRVSRHQASTRSGVQRRWPCAREASSSSADHGVAAGRVTARAPAARRPRRRGRPGRPSPRRASRRRPRTTPTRGGARGPARARGRGRAAPRRRSSRPRNTRSTRSTAVSPTHGRGSMATSPRPAPPSRTLPGWRSPCSGTGAAGSAARRRARSWPRRSRSTATAELTAAARDRTPAHWQSAVASAIVIPVSGVSLRIGNRRRPGAATAAPGVSADARATAWTPRRGRSRRRPSRRRGPRSP